MELLIERGTEENIHELECLYNSLIIQLDKEFNYAKWATGVYPTADTARMGIESGSLWTAKLYGEIVGTIVLNHDVPKGYRNAVWPFETDYTDVLIVHTLAVHPDYLKCSIGKALIEFAVTHGRNTQMKAIRLDTWEGNLPAIRLYESCGFQYIDTIDLELDIPDLGWFKVYELVL